MRIIFIFFLFFIFSCDNYHQKSFNQLSEAFNTWYLKSIDSDFNSFFVNLNNGPYPEINSHIISEFKEDINRFELELSQINSNHLGKANKSNFVILNNKLNDLKFKHNFLDVTITDPVYYLDRIGYHFNYFFYNNTYSIEDNFLLLNSLIKSTESFLNQSKFLLNKSFTYDLCEQKINIIISDLVLFLSQEKFNEFKQNDILLHKAKDLFNDYLVWIKENTSLINLNDLDSFDDYYTNFHFEDRDDLEKMRINVTLDIDSTYKEMFQSALSIYLVDNDEPVWVDKTDSADVVNWSINYLLKKDVKFQFDSLRFLDSLNMKQNYLYKLNLTDINNKIPISNQTGYMFSDLNDILSDYYDYNISNNDKYLYLSEYFSNAFTNSIINHFPDVLNLKKDVNLKLLFYLNLYYRLNKIYYQDMYFKGEISSASLSDEINSIPFISKKQKYQIFIESHYPYYFLKEYSIYKKLSKEIIENTLVLKSRKNIINFLNNNIK